MRLLIAVLCSAVSFLLGVAVEKHRSGDELGALRYDVNLLGAQVETLGIRCKSLEREAAELEMRAKSLLPHIEL